MQHPQKYLRFRQAFQLLALACLGLLSGSATAFSVPAFTNQLATALKLGWLFDGADIRLIIEKTRAGHAAIGIGRDMSDADIVLVQTSGGVLTVQDCYLNAEVAPLCDESQNWTIVDSTISTDGFKVEIKRTAAAQESHDKTYSASYLSIIYSYTDNPTVAMHSHSSSSDYGTKIINFATGDTKSEWAIWGDGSFMTHEHTQLLIWSVICDLLIFAGRYAKRVTRYFDGHAWPFLAVLVISLVFRDNESKGKLPKGQKQETPGKDFHETFAVFVLILTFLIIINGFFVRYLIEFMKNHLHLKHLPVSRKVHIVLGILIWVMTRITLFSGCKLTENQYNAGAPLLALIIETVVFLAIIIAMEVYKWYSHQLRALQISDAVTAKPEDAEAILADVNSLMGISDLKKKYPGRNVMIFMDKVYDLGSYIHPGGHQIFKDVRFREVSRFVYGGVGFEVGNSPSWSHSADTFAVLNRSCIGELSKQSSPQQDQLVVQKNGEAAYSQSDETWVVDASKKVSSTTSVIEFKAINKFQIKLLARGTAWIGRHYMVYGDNRARPYTNCTSLAKEYLAYQKSLIQSFDSLVSRGVPSKVEVPPETVDYLPLCIKEYVGPDALSARLCRASPGDRFRIAGPIGRGLEIPAGFTGKVVMVAAGTGVLPFVDLLDLLLKKLFYAVLAKKGLPVDQIHPHQDYHSLFPGIAWKFLGTFRSLPDFVGSHVVEALHAASGVHEPGFFSGLAKVSGEAESLRLPQTKAVFDAAFLKDHVREEQGRWPLVLLCATPAMIASVTTDLVGTIGLPEGNLVYV